MLLIKKIDKMKLQEFKNLLNEVSEVNFKLENGDNVSNHYHITEVGQINKNFIDCGGTVRKEQKVNFQLWHSFDYWHRLDAKKILSIIELSEAKIGVENHEIEVEYQTDTISKYGIVFDGKDFILTAQNTACLALDKCGIPTVTEIKEKVQACCTPGGGCC